MGHNSTTATTGYLLSTTAGHTTVVYIINTDICPKHPNITIRTLQS